MPIAAQDLIREKVKAGLARRNEIKPLQPQKEMTLELTYRKRKLAKRAASLPNADLVGSHRVRFAGSIIEISEFIEAACG